MVYKKDKIQVPSIYNLREYLKKDKILPIYFFFGSDHFTIDQAVKAVSKIVESEISSEFDKETITVKKKDSLVPVLDIASAFPFGSGKKLLIVKNFELFSDKNIFTKYVNLPLETTVLIAVYYGKISGLGKEPYKSLIKQNYIFEASELRRKDLEKWACSEAKRLGVELSLENSMLLLDIVGGDKSLVAAQLKKIGDFLNGKGEITTEIITQMASETKEYSIFNLQDAIKIGDKSKALYISYNLLKHNFEPLQIMGMITKLISIIAQSIELKAQNLNSFEAAKKMGISKYYYDSCTRGNFFKSDKKLLNASRALLNADLKIKTSTIDKKTLMTTLITEMLQ